MSKNNFILRLENLADKFDGEEVGIFAIGDFCKCFWSQVNSDPVPSYSIEELALTAGLPYDANEEYKKENRWTGDDENFTEVQPLQDEEGLFILEPQRIRTFSIKFGEVDISEKIDNTI